MFSDEHKQMEEILKDGLRKLGSNEIHKVKIEISLEGKMAIAYETLLEIWKLSKIANIEEFNRTLIIAGIKKMTNVDDLMNKLCMINSINVVKIDSLNGLEKILKLLRGEKDNV